MRLYEKSSSAISILETLFTIQFLQSLSSLLHHIRFKYRVDDRGGSNTPREPRNLHTKTENRSEDEGGRVEGEYRVLLPDKRIQVVRYDKKDNL